MITLDENENEKILFRADGISVQPEKGNVFTAEQGSVAISTSVTKSGTASIYASSSSIVVSNDNQALAEMVQGDFTVEFWVYIVKDSYGSGSNAMLAIGRHGSNKIGVAFCRHNGGSVTYGVHIGVKDGSYLGINYINTSSPIGAWHHFAITRKGSVYKIYYDGVLKNTNTSGPTSICMYDNSVLFGINTWNNGYSEEYLEGLRIYNYAKEAKELSYYSYPNDIFKRGLLCANNPINLLSKTSVTGFDITGIEPENTKRRIAFKVDDIWNKLDTEGNLIALTKTEDETATNITDDDLTADYLLENGNTAEELTALTTTTGLAGKLIYPAIAMYASGYATEMPTFGMTVKALIDTTVNVYTYTAYSQEYALSDTDVKVISIATDTTIKGGASIDIQCRLMQNGEWTEYMAVTEGEGQKASKIQFKVNYAVSSVDSDDSCQLNKISVLYMNSGALVTGGKAQLITEVEDFDDVDVRYGRLLIKHEAFENTALSAYVSMSSDLLDREKITLGVGDGTNKTFTLGVDGVADEGIDFSTLKLYQGSELVTEYDFNSATSQVTVSVPASTTLFASYRYNCQPETWTEMTLASTQKIKDKELYNTSYTYSLPYTENEKHRCAVKVVMDKDKGTVTNQFLCKGTGTRQQVYLPYHARKDTLEVTASVGSVVFSYNQDTKLLTFFATKNADVFTTYDWEGTTAVLTGMVVCYNE